MDSNGEEIHPTEGHVVLPRFGFTIDPDAYLNDLAETLRKHKRKSKDAMDYTYYSIARLEAYLEAYKIVNYDDPSLGPLAAVSLHPAENVMRNGPMQMKIWRYHSLSVYEHFKLSLTEFLSLPRYWTDHIFARCVEIEAERNPDIKKEVNKYESGKK